MEMSAKAEEQNTDAMNIIDILSDYFLATQINSDNTLTKNGYSDFVCQGNMLMVYST